MSMPLDKKRSRGRIPLRKKALRRDPHLLADIPRTIVDSESDEEAEQPKHKKRIILTGPVRKSKRLN